MATYQVKYKGKLHTRSSERQYSYAVCITDRDGSGVLAWCARRDLAEKQVTRAKKWGPEYQVSDVSILEVSA